MKPRTKPLPASARAAFLAPLLVLLAACAGAPRREAPAPLPLVPQPADVRRQDGRFELRDGMALVAAPGSEETLGIARRFADLLRETRGLRLAVRAAGAADGDGRRDVAFALDAAAPGGEGYALAVGERGIRVAAREPRGLFYGSVTLWQLLTAETARTDRIEVPAVRIEDAPRFAWRGALLDSARHYQPPEFVERFIDQLALAKLNVLHWHLTDDQGWRLEVPRYPRLTAIGAWRRPAGAAGTDAQGRPVREGGYYTQEDVRRIVRHAAERNVTIVPEIDMPGHMQAAIAAYPELGSGAAPAGPSADWGVHTHILNVDESTFAFMQNVLDEVVALFPGPYVHVGGDEAVKDEWKASPRVQARMRALGIADEEHLQGWFVARMGRFLAARGRRLVGWDEILEGGPPADAVVMSWRGAGGGAAAARAGHDVVLSPSPDLYLDHLQSDAADEPAGRTDVRSLADVYAFQPLPAGLDAAAAAHVLGAQANLWSEHMRTPERVEHAAFPRLAALAEVLWSPSGARDWNGFVRRLVPQMERYRALGVAAADSAFEVRVAAVRDGDAAATVALSDQAGLPIRYATGGRAPDARSPLYEAPLRLPLPAEVRAAAFLGARRAGPVETFALDAAAFLRRSSDALRPCSGALGLRLEDDAPADGPRAFFDVDLFDPCWRWPQAPLDRAARIAVTVGQLPYNFQLWKDSANVVPRPPPSSPQGELLVRRDSCRGAVLAALPLAAAAARPATTRLEAALPSADAPHDLCFVFAARGTDPLWAIDRVELLPATP